MFPNRSSAHNGKTTENVLIALHFRSAERRHPIPRRPSFQGRKRVRAAHPPRRNIVDADFILLSRTSIQSREFLRSVKSCFSPGGEKENRGKSEENQTEPVDKANIKSGKISYRFSNSVLCCLTRNNCRLEINLKKSIFGWRTQCKSDN